VVSVLLAVVVSVLIVLVVLLAVVDLTQFEA
jgi:hypothetical protein